MDQQQIDTTTCLNRYPTLFKTVSNIVPGEAKVLSFGCSNGAEVRSLKQVGAKWTVHGLDKNTLAIRDAKQSDPGGVYVTDASELVPLSYDIIFCMSVLCRFPGDYFTYTFPHFIEASSVIDGLLKPGGILVLYNAQFAWFSTRVGADLYTELKSDKIYIHKTSGFIPKMLPDGRMMTINASQSVPWIYKKNLTVSPSTPYRVSPAGVTQLHVKGEGGGYVSAGHPNVQPWYPSSPGKPLVPWNWPGFRFTVAPSLIEVYALTGIEEETKRIAAIQARTSKKSVVSTQTDLQSSQKSTSTTTTANTITSSKTVTPSSSSPASTVVVTAARPKPIPSSRVKGFFNLAKQPVQEVQPIVGAWLNA